MPLNLCRIILIETHYPGNLGAAARVMRNFGLSDLVLVAPVAVRRDKDALRMSTHGESILNDARVVTHLDEALGDCVLLAGTSARTGGLLRQQNVAAPRRVMPHVVDLIKQDRRAALIFGPEPTGLTNEIVTRCHHLIEIPTADNYASLNLAQAVAICAYELHTAWSESQAHPSVKPTESLAALDAQERMFAQLRTALEEIHFLYGDKAEPLMHAIRHLLGKGRLTDMEVKVLLGLARQIRWYVANHPDKIA